MAYIQTELGKVLPFFDKLKSFFDPRVNCVVSGDLHPALVQYAEVSITPAQLKACRTTPIELVAAPGAGYVNEFLDAFFIYDYEAAYTETADNLVARFTNGSGAIASTTLETTGLLDATSDQIRTFKQITTDITPVANSAIVLHNTGDGEFGGTGSPVRIKVAYRVHATGL